MRKLRALLVVHAIIEAAAGVVLLAASRAGSRVSTSTATTEADPVAHRVAKQYSRTVKARR